MDKLIKNILNICLKRLMIMDVTFFRYFAVGEFFSKQDRWAVLLLSSRIPFLIADIKYVSDAQEGWLGST